MALPNAYVSETYVLELHDDEVEGPDSQYAYWRVIHSGSLRWIKLMRAQIPLNTTRIAKVTTIHEVIHDHDEEVS